MQKICIVIPCYNEQERLSVEEFINAYNNTPYYYLFVNDGSTDRTIDILKKIQKGRKDRIYIINENKNDGKAEAVRKGILKANQWTDFNIIGFLDADLSTPLTDIPKLIKFINNEILFVFGARVKRLGANINRKWYRHLIGRVFATIASFMLGINVYDTQCGAKFFNVSIIKTVFNDKFISKWIFDLEIFYRLLNTYIKKDINSYTKEIPLDYWVDINGSKLRFRHFFEIPFNMLKLYLYYKKNLPKL